VKSSPPVKIEIHTNSRALSFNCGSAALGINKFKTSNKALVAAMNDRARNLLNCMPGCAGLSDMIFDATSRRHIHGQSLGQGVINFSTIGTGDHLLRFGPIGIPIGGMNETSEGRQGKTNG
jgi:hypothetical protein